MEKRNILWDKSFEFALTIVDLAQELKELRHFELGSQLVRSGTSVGANIVEAQRAESKKDFIHKLKISLKEADETKYWLRIIDLKIKKVDKELLKENEELIRLLVSIIKSTQKNMKS